MKIKEAIKTLRYIGRAQTIMWKQEHYDALRLGIEGLKFKHEWDMGRIFDNNYLLPGETLD